MSINGQLKFYWISSKGKKEELIDSLAEGLLKIHIQSLLEVNDDSIDFNVGGISYYHEEYLKPEYKCEDGFVEFLDENSMDAYAILDEIYQGLEKWEFLQRQDIVNYIIKEEIKGEVPEIKMY